MLGFVRAGGWPGSVGWLGTVGDNETEAFVAESSPVPPLVHATRSEATTSSTIRRDATPIPLSNHRLGGPRSREHVRTARR